MIIDTPEMTMDANVNPNFAETENPADVPYTALNSLSEDPEGGKFSLPIGGIVTTVGVGSFEGELVKSRLKSKAAAVEETDAAGSVAAAAVELETAASVEELASAVAMVVVAVAIVVASVVDVMMAGQQVSSESFM